MTLPERDPAEVMSSDEQAALEHVLATVNAQEDFVTAPRPTGLLWKADRTAVLMILENHTDVVTGEIKEDSIGDLANDLIGYCAQLREESMTDVSRDVTPAEDNANRWRLHAIRGILHQLYSDRNSSPECATVEGVRARRVRAVADIKLALDNDWRADADQ